MPAKIINSRINIELRISEIIEIIACIGAAEGEGLSGDEADVIRNKLQRELDKLGLDVRDYEFLSEPKTEEQLLQEEINKSCNW